MTRAACYLLLPILVSAGCARPPYPALAPERAGPGPATARAHVTIAIGQAWGEAEDVARSQGYELHDASHLAVQPTPDGFVINMPASRGLIVLREPRTQTVSVMLMVENWGGSKAVREYHSVDSFQVPPAGPDGKD